MMPPLQALNDAEERMLLAEQLADASARETLEMLSVPKHIDGIAHFCLDDASLYDHERADLRRAARYLELRRMLCRNTSHPDCVRFIERPRDFDTAR
jgi:hypothetical protein